MKKILFLLKQNQSSGGEYTGTSKSGLLNSAKLVSEFLDHWGLNTKLVVCVDGNSVDKEVYEYRPDVCIIEALWVTPDKLREVQRLHPKVQFIVRIHSEVAFLANEGIALNWIQDYVNIPNTHVALNSKSAYIDFRKALDLDNLVYLPNLYPFQSEKGIKGLKRRWIQYVLDTSTPNFRNKVLNIGCFGSVRPMKNTLVQAFAALQFSNKYKVPINFHINAGRLEQGGESNLKNIRALFKNTPQATLVEHGWLEREDFLKLIRQMDVGMQISFTESFNIVSADFVSQKVPIIVSEDIDWMPELSKLKPTDTESIVRRLADAVNYEDLFVDYSIINLNKYIKKAFVKWIDFLV